MIYGKTRKSCRFDLVGLQGITLAALLGISMLASAQEMPGEKEIIESLTPHIPVWWSVDAVSIEASVNDGDAVDPRIRQRFIATVTPVEDLFESVDTIGPFTVLIPVQASGEPQKLYGIASSALQLGRWAVQIRLGNTVEQLGAPEALFEGPTVVAGSDELEKSSETMRILGFLKDRWETSLSGLDSAIETMKRDSRELISELSGQTLRKMDAARETLAAIDQAISETAAQEQLTKALEEKVAASDRAIEARKQLYQSLRTKLGSEDSDERLAAFQSIFVSDHYELSQQERQNLLEIVLKTKDPALQGAALFRIFARQPELHLKPIKLTHDDEGTAAGHILSLEIKRLQTNYTFKGGLKFNEKDFHMRTSGSIHGNQLILTAKTRRNDNRTNTQCVWNAFVEDDGVLRGEIECSSAERVTSEWEKGLERTVSGIWETRFFF